MLRESFGLKAGTSAAAARRELPSLDDGNFVLLLMSGIMSDSINSRSLYLVAGLLSRRVDFLVADHLGRFLYLRLG